jgi:hypothetical protein
VRWHGGGPGPGAGDHPAPAGRSELFPQIKSIYYK